MKAQNKLAETITPDGARLVLFEHDGRYAIRMNGQGLMHSMTSASELLLGEIGTQCIRGITGVRVLIGGLGLGFTLKSVLAHLHPSASVHVAELLPAVVAWNREFLTSLNGNLLADHRVTVFVEDVFCVLTRVGAEAAKYDAILLDIDNGPSAMVQEDNERVYSDAGISTLASALNAGGRAVIWSAGEDAAFARRLSFAGFAVDVVRAKQHTGARRSAIVLYIADMPR